MTETRQVNTEFDVKRRRVHAFWITQLFGMPEHQMGLGSDGRKQMPRKNDHSSQVKSVLQGWLSSHSEFPHATHPPTFERDERVFDHDSFMLASCGKDGETDRSKGRTPSYSPIHPSKRISECQQSI